MLAALLSAGEVTDAQARSALTQAVGGGAATAALQTLVGGREVECFEQHRDRWRRVVAVCYVGPWSLNAAMVRGGWALDFEEYSGGIYRLDQEAAQAERLGLWRGEFMPPWEWRRRR